MEIYELNADFASALTRAFCVPGWNKPLDQYEERYLTQHNAGDIKCLVATVDDSVAGYLKIVWETTYAPQRDEGIPEIQDLNVLAEFRRRGVATALMDRAEAEIAKRSPKAGIGVGLHPGYNAAQRMYVVRGYVPDACGITYGDRFVEEGEVLPFDDSLALHFTKELPR